MESNGYEASDQICTELGMLEEGIHPFSAAGRYGSIEHHYISAVRRTKSVLEPWIFSFFFKIVKSF